MNYGIVVSTTKDGNGGDIVSIQGGPIIPPIQVNMRAEKGIQQYTMSVSESEAQFAAGIGSRIVVGTSQIYDGPYEVTPSAEMQTLQTKNFRMTDNIVVNPIPSNYGLITWNGSIITVS